MPKRSPEQEKHHFPIKRIAGLIALSTLLLSSSNPMYFSDPTIKAFYSTISNSEKPDFIWNCPDQMTEIQMFSQGRKLTFNKNAFDELFSSECQHQNKKLVIPVIFNKEIPDIDDLNQGGATNFELSIDAQYATNINGVTIEANLLALRSYANAIKTECSKQKANHNPDCTLKIANFEDALNLFVFHEIAGHALEFTSMIRIEKLCQTEETARIKTEEYYANLQDKTSPKLLEIQNTALEEK